MRLTRRGVIAQRKGGFIWAVYELAMGIDESAGGTNGTVSLTSTRYKRVAKSYTVSASGTVSLVDSVQTTAANMVVGDYLVNVSTSNNTSTTGTTLYKITATSGTSTRKITYKAYTPSLSVKGTDTGDRVESADGTAYPHNGAQGGYWYVLLRGYTTAHVWDVFNVKTTTAKVYAEKKTTNSGTYGKEIDLSGTIYYSDNYTFNTKTGKYSLSSSKSMSASSFAIACQSDPPGTYFIIGSSSGTTMYSGITDGSTTTEVWVKYTWTSTSTSETTEAKGTATGETVQSVDENAYPQDGAQDGYWYVYGGTKEVYIDNT